MDKNRLQLNGLNGYILFLLSTDLSRTNMPLLPGLRGRPRPRHSADHNDGSPRNKEMNPVCKASLLCKSRSERVGVPDSAQVSD